MNVCVIGSGGREHAILWSLRKSPSIEELFVVPGSDAMENLAQRGNFSWADREQLLTFLTSHVVDLVVIGPEAPLVEGLTDYLRGEGFWVFGPSQKAAQLEGSKAFAKDLMKKYGIPTAAYQVFTKAGEAKVFAHSLGAPVVIKADGLAAGKGVVVATSLDQAEQAIDHMLEDNQFGSAGARVVVEEFMEGEEASLLAFVDGKTLVPMVGAQDHKRIYDGDRGPNTGGMGTYAPAPILTEERKRQAMETILEPLVAAMAQEGMPYIGCLYAGLMITEEGPKVVEFNARFGDPETQVILPLLEGDLGRIMMACAQGCLDPKLVAWKNGSAACVIMASQGYPVSSHKGDIISGPLEAGPQGDVIVFHSGTRYENGSYQTNGGRVLGVVGLGPDLRSALDKAYGRVEKISFDGAQYRHDIGAKAFKAK